MKRYTYKIAEELSSGNIWDILLADYLQFPILIQRENQWVVIDEIPFISNLKERWSELRTEYCTYIYGCEEFTVMVDEYMLAVAIARNPLEKHFVATDEMEWCVWNNHRSIYEKVKKNINELDEEAVIQWPEFIFHKKAGMSLDILSNRHHVKTTENLEIANTFLQQVRQGVVFLNTQPRYKKSYTPREKANEFIDRLPMIIQKDLLEKEEFYLPSIGRFRNNEGRVRFTPNKILLDRLRSKTPDEDGRKKRIYGGEVTPNRNMKYWSHHSLAKQSRRRKLAMRLGKDLNHKQQFISLQSSVVQSFTDAIAFRLCHGIHVTIKGVGTIRVQFSDDFTQRKLFFRTSAVFRKSYQERK